MAVTMTVLTIFTGLNDLPVVAACQAIAAAGTAFRAGIGYADSH